MNFEHTIPFDPGFSKHLGNFYINVDYAYERLGVIKNFNQKKFQFQKFFPVISKDINRYICFYIGCMLWAIYIKQFEVKEISENPVLNENINDEDGLFQIKYLRDFLPKFEKDSKYFLNKTIKFEQEKFDIIDIYMKFLQMNKHFTDTKTSSDIQLPFEVKNPDYDLILQTIEKVTLSGDFEPLYDLKNLILDSAV